jgi:hypothetical protein
LKVRPIDALWLMSSRTAVGTPAGLDRGNSLGRQRLVTHEKLAVLLRKGVIRRHAELVVVAQAAAEREEQRRLAAARRCPP